MAKQLVSWTETDGRLFMNRTNAVPAETLAIFDIRVLFPQFPYMTDVQKYITIKGIKEGLSDSGASAKTAEAKAENARKKWALFMDGKTKEKKAATESKAAKLDSLLAMSPEEALEAIKAMQADA